MAKIVDRKNLKLENGVLQVFGCRGFTLGRWAWYISVMNNPYYAKHEPFSVCSEIEATVEGKNLGYVKVLPETVIAMYLSGKITEQDMSLAMINDASIVFPKVKFLIKGVTKEINVVAVPRCNL